MLKKTIRFNGLDNKEHEEVWYFNLTEVEVTRLDAEFEPSLAEYIEQMDENTPRHVTLSLFERLIQMSVGEKSPDGTRFIKNEDVVNDFLASQAYSALFAELATSPDVAAEFFNEALTMAQIQPQTNKPKN